ncbi:hypothetical protein FACS189499_00610 [Clostridia bacterium]|nr:hypothetical protein FACS189499_00610 [Clostridia bacterium]
MYKYFTKKYKKYLQKLCGYVIIMLRTYYSNNTTDMEIILIKEAKLNGNHKIDCPVRGVGGTGTHLA